MRLAVLALMSFWMAAAGAAAHTPIFIVETERQLQILQDQGCDEIQGYLIARPLPEQDLPTWQATWQHAGLASFETKARAAER